MTYDTSESEKEDVWVYVAVPVIEAEATAEEEEDERGVGGAVLLVLEDVVVTAQEDVSSETDDSPGEACENDIPSFAGVDLLWLILVGFCLASTLWSMFFTVVLQPSSSHTISRSPSKISTTTTAVTVVAETLDIPKSLGIDTSPSHVITLTTETFSKFMATNDHVFVEYTRPECEFSKMLQPTWKDLAKVVADRSLNVAISTVDCAVDPEICRVQQIFSFPSLRWYEHGVGNNIKTDGQKRSLQQLLEFVDKTLATMATDSNDIRVFEPPGALNPALLGEDSVPSDDGLGEDSENAALKDTMLSTVESAVSHSSSVIISVDERASPVEKSLRVSYPSLVTAPTRKNEMGQDWPETKRAKNVQAGGSPVVRGSTEKVNNAVAIPTPAKAVQAVGTENSKTRDTQSHLTTVETSTKPVPTRHFSAFVPVPAKVHSAPRIPAVDLAAVSRKEAPVLYNEPTNKVISLTKETLRPFLSNNKFVFVSYIGVDCQDCATLAEEWNAFATLVRKGALNVAVGTIDCALESKLCDRHLITSFPSFRWFQNAMPLYGYYRNYPRTASDFVEYAEEKIAAVAADEEASKTTV